MRPEQRPKGITISVHWNVANETVTIVSGTVVSYLNIPGSNPHWAIVAEDLVITLTINMLADFQSCADQG